MRAIKGKGWLRQVSLVNENHRLINTLCEVSLVVRWNFKFVILTIIYVDRGTIDFFSDKAAVLKFLT